MGKNNIKRIPKDRMHNPNGGGFRPTAQVHKHIKDKKAESIEDKIIRTGKLTMSDLKNLCNLEEE
jgi:hypothetical protein